MEKLKSSLGEDKVSAQTGSFVYMPPMLTHGISAKTPVRMLLIQIKAGRTDSFESQPAGSTHNISPGIESEVAARVRVHILSECLLTVAQWHPVLERPARISLAPRYYLALVDHIDPSAIFKPDDRVRELCTFDRR
jgi:hypothetical protein